MKSRKLYIALLLFCGTVNSQILSQGSLNLTTRYGFLSNINLSNDSPFGFIPPGYDSDALQLFALMSPQPSIERKNLISNIYKMFKDSLAINHLNQKFDFMYFMAQFDSSSSKLDWTLNGFNFSTVNKLNFAVDTGWTRSAAGSYINTNYNISTNSVTYTQNAASLFIYSRTNVNETTIDLGIRAASFESRVSSRLGGNLFGDINSNLGSVSIAVANSLGLSNTVRRGASETEIYRNGSSVVTNLTDPSVALISANIFITAANNGAGAAVFPCTRQVSFAACGGAFTDTEVRMIFNIVEYYMDQLNVGVVP